MNGDFQVIFDELKVMSEKQDKRHEQNLKTFGKLPCRFHAAMINALWIVFGTGLISCLLFVLIRKVMAE